MADELPAKVSSAVESPIFLTLFRLAVPALLGAILTYAATISAAQTHQSDQLSEMKGQLGIIGAQTTDYVARLSKLEVRADETNKQAATNSARILVLESNRHYK